MPPIMLGSIAGAGAAGSNCGYDCFCCQNQAGYKDAAFVGAEQLTLTGSIIPWSIMLTHSPVAALKPVPSAAFFQTIDNDEGLQAPALWAIWRTGSSKARRTILRPVLHLLSIPLATAGIAFTRAVPPPATIPSSRLRVALRASSMRSLVLAQFRLRLRPWWLQHLAILPSVLTQFSRSNSDVVVSIWDLITATR